MTLLQLITFIKTKIFCITSFLKLYADQAIYTLIGVNWNTFQGHKSEDWIKHLLKLLFHFHDTLETKQITELQSYISSYHSINQKILSIGNFVMFFRNTVRCKSGYEWYFNKPFCRNLQDQDMNKTKRFGVCECY